MPESDALTADEVAQLLRVSRNTVYNLVKRDELASYYVGRKMRFSRADVENYIARSAVLAKAAGAKGFTTGAGASGAAGPRDGSGVHPAPIGSHGPSLVDSDGSPDFAANRTPAEASSAAAAGSFAGARESRTIPAAAASAFSARGLSQVYVIAGNDIMGDMLANYLGATSHVAFERVYEGSYAALVDVYAGRAQAALTHLYDRSGAYNAAFVERIMPGMPVRLVRLVRRRQGLIVAKGNPKGLRAWADLGRSDVRIANRERGCGSRVLLDEKLAECGVSRACVAGYGREHPSALSAASLVARGAADVCVGSERVFHQVEGIDFLPLQDEWLDIALSLESPACERVADAVCRLVRTRPFRQEAGRIVGYDASCMGEVVLERR